MEYCFHSYQKCHKCQPYQFDNSKHKHFSFRFGPTEKGIIWNKTNGGNLHRQKEDMSNYKKNEIKFHSFSFVWRRTMFSIFNYQKGLIDIVSGTVGSVVVYWPSTKWIRFHFQWGPRQNLYCFVSDVALKK